MPDPLVPQDGLDVAPGATETPPAYVTPEQLDAALSKFANDTKAMFGRIQQQLSTPPATPPAPVPTVPAKDETDPKAPPAGSDTMAARIAELEREAAAARQRDGRLRENAKRAALRDALVNHGADPDLATMALSDIIGRYGPAIQVAENAAGGYDVTVDEGDGPKSPRDWTHLFLQTDGGKKLVLPKLTPFGGTAPNGSAPAGTIRMTRAEMAKADPAVLKSGRVEVVD